MISPQEILVLLWLAGKVTVVQVDEIVDLGSLDPEAIVTPGIFVDRIIQLDAPNYISK